MTDLELNDLHREVRRVADALSRLERALDADTARPRLVSRLAKAGPWNLTTVCAGEESDGVWRVSLILYLDGDAVDQATPSPLVGSREQATAGALDALRPLFAERLRLTVRDRGGDVDALVEVAAALAPLADDGPVRAFYARPLK